MSNRTMTIPANRVRVRLGSLLQRVAKNRSRFLITKSGKPAAVLLGITDFDDMLEELDPEFQASLKIACREYRAGGAIRLREYLKERSAARHCLAFTRR